jgi:hypothetical protein
MISAKSVLLKTTAERSVAENDALARHLMQTTFAQQIKLKDKDCREIMQGMRYKETTPGEDIVTFGDRGSHFYIIF